MTEGRRIAVLGTGTMGRALVPGLRSSGGAERARLAATCRQPAELEDPSATPARCTTSALLALEDGRLRYVLAHDVQEAARAAAELGPGDPA